MSDKVRAWVWELDLPPARKLVLLWLAGRATDNGVAFPGEREIRDKTGLGERMVRYHLGALVTGGADQNDAPRRPLLFRIERRVGAARNTSNVYILRVPWAEQAEVRRDLEELKHIPESAMTKVLTSVGVGATGCPQVDSSGGNGLPSVGEAGCPEVGATGCREESSLRNSHGNTPPRPPMRVPQQQGEVVAEANQTVPLTGDADRERTARTLAEAFYHGLGADLSAVTPPLRKRDLAIARNLVDVGASAPEAEAYAREMTGNGTRIAPVDLRSFERERLGWQARRRAHDLDRRRIVDRTGQPPSWQSERSANPGCAGPVATGSDDGTVRDEHDERLRQTLRHVLLGQNC